MFRPSSVPVIDDLAEARRTPELVVLSAVAHGAASVETAVEIALAASAAVRELEVTASRYTLH